MCGPLPALSSAKDQLSSQALNDHQHLLVMVAGEVLILSLTHLPGIQLTAGVHRHPGATAGNQKRFLEDGPTAEVSHHRHAHSVQREKEGVYLRAMCLLATPAPFTAHSRPGCCVHCQRSDWTSLVFTLTSGLYVSSETRVIIAPQ